MLIVHYYGAMLVTLPIQKRKSHPSGWDFLLAGETRLEHATNGFGDRDSTN